MFVIFTILIYALKLNKKKGTTRIAGSVALSLGAGVINFIIDLIISMVRYIFFENKTFNIGLGMFMSVTPLLIMFVTVWLISKIAGCEREVGIILAISSFFLITALLLSYVSIITRWNMEFDVNDAAFLNALVESEEEKQARIFDGIRNVISFIPALSYILCCFMYRF